VTDFGKPLITWRKPIPINSYFKGRGDKVMRSMVSKYGKEKGKGVFYATANKKKMAPPKRKM